MRISFRDNEICMIELEAETVGQNEILRAIYLMLVDASETEKEKLISRVTDNQFQNLADDYNIGIDDIVPTFHELIDKVSDNE